MAYVGTHRALRPLPHDPETVRRAFETGEYPYSTRLTEKEYLRRMQPLQVELELERDLRKLELRYTALSLAAPEKVRFRYRLDGFDTGWVDAAGLGPRWGGRVATLG